MVNFLKKVKNIRKGKQRFRTWVHLIELLMMKHLKPLSQPSILLEIAISWLIIKVFILFREKYLVTFVIKENSFFWKKSYKPIGICWFLISCSITRYHINPFSLFLRKNNASINFRGGEMLKVISVVCQTIHKGIGAECVGYTIAHPIFVHFHSKFTVLSVFWSTTENVLKF